MFVARLLRETYEPELLTGSSYYDAVSDVMVVEVRTYAWCHDVNARTAMRQARSSVAKVNRTSTVPAGGSAHKLRDGMGGQRCVHLRVRWPQQSHPAGGVPPLRPEKQPGVDARRAVSFCGPGPRPNDRGGGDTLPATYTACCHDASSVGRLTSSHTGILLQVYPEPLQSFASDTVPGPVFTIPVVEQGRAALEAIDKVRCVFNFQSCCFCCID